MRIITAAILIAAVGLTACVSSTVREGQRLFAGCSKAVDDKATLKAGVFVCRGAKEPNPFGGNGRACGTCHVPGDNFGLSIKRIAALPADDPLFFPLDEDPKLLRAHGLVRVIVPGSLDEFRATPKLVHLRRSCDTDGNCDSLGLLGDRVIGRYRGSLNAFAVQAIANHLSKTTARVPGKDFRVPTARELRALTEYQLSRLVSEQDERNRGK